MTGRRGVALLAATALALGSSSGCVRRGSGLSRDQLRDRYVDELVDEGIAPDVAACVIDGFFAPLSDGELQDFNLTGDDLSPDEEARIAALTRACLAERDQPATSA